MSDETSTHQGQGEIIIVKKVQGGGGGHHGGAWKIAYADFVTAMMAFFLVMWLVNAANENTKASVASYFNPIKLTDTSPSDKDVKENAQQEEGEQSKEASTTDSDQKTAGEGADEGKQEKTMAGEETENSEADYFENPYAVLSEIVMDTAEESNISEKGDGGAQNSGAATGASGGEAYRDPFDPDFWSKQISSNVTDTGEVVDPTELMANQQLESSQLEDDGLDNGGLLGDTEGESSESTASSDMEGQFGLNLGAGDVFGKTAGAGEDVNAGAALSDYDVGGDKTGLAPFEGDMGGKEFDEDGRHISNLEIEDNSSSAIPPGNSRLEDIDPNRLATLYEEGNKNLDELRDKGSRQRLTPSEAEELLDLIEQEKNSQLDAADADRKDELLAKNASARQTAQEIADLQEILAEYANVMMRGALETQEDGAELTGGRIASEDGGIDAKPQEADQFAGVSDEQREDAENLEREIKKAFEGVSGKLAEGLIVTPAEGGILLSLTDQLNVGMFNVGSAIPKRDTILLMEKIGNVLNQRRGAIAIRGHTDSRPFSAGGNDNWRLSMSRAHSAYFMLVRGGIPEERITQVTGFADRRLKDPENPFSELNRRIEILIQPEDT